MLWSARELHLESFLDGVHAPRVLCIGDVMLDRFVYGRVDRVSAEAPIPILHVSSKQTMLGGAGNVGRNVVALGADAVLIGVTGDDHAASHIADLAESEERLTPRLIVEAGRPSTVKTRVTCDWRSPVVSTFESPYVSTLFWMLTVRVSKPRVCPKAAKAQPSTVGAASVACSP